jgi:hypothetical protein
MCGRRTLCLGNMGGEEEVWGYTPKRLWLTILGSRCSILSDISFYQSLVYTLKRLWLTILGLRCSVLTDISFYRCYLTSANHYKLLYPSQLSLAVSSGSPTGGHFLRGSSWMATISLRNSKTKSVEKYLHCHVAIYCLDTAMNLVQFRLKEFHV